MPNSRFMVMLTGLGVLGACNAPGEGGAGAPGGNGGDTAMRAESEGNGAAQVSLDLPGVEGRFRIPSIRLGRADVDIDGVKLYPGAKVTGVDLAGEEGHSEGAVTIRFRADAAPAAVRDYFVAAFREQGVSAKASGAAIAGRDSNGKPFRIDLAAEGEGTIGTLRLGSERR